LLWQLSRLLCSLCGSQFWCESFWSKCGSVESCHLSSATLTSHLSDWAAKGWHLSHVSRSCALRTNPVSRTGHHAQILLQHGTKDTKLTELLKHSWEAMHLELGLPGALTYWNYALLGDCATDCWLKTVWKYCRDNTIGILDDKTQLQLKRTGDQF
jgi:hypothetical protein